MGLMADERWFVAYTLARKEALALAHLQRQGFHAFLPRIMTTHRHARQIMTVPVPLFPRYVFVRLDLEHQRWRAINGTVGVQTLVTALDTPTPVPHGIVEDLLDCAGADGVIDRNGDLQAGDAVRLVGGPFDGSIGTLTRLDERGRVEVLFKWLNGDVRMKTARHMVEAVR